MNDKPFTDRLREELVAAIGRTQTRGAKPGGGRTLVRQPAARWTLVTLGVAVLVSAGVVAYVTSPRGPSQGQGHPFAGIVAPNEFLNGISEGPNITRVEELTGFRVPRPNDPLGNDGMIVNIFYAPNTPGGDAGTKLIQVGIIYSSGLYVEMHTDAQLAAPAAFTAAATDVAANSHGEARLSTVNGQTAMSRPSLIPLPNPTTGKVFPISNWSSNRVEIERNGLYMIILGNFPVGDLLRVAGTVN